MQIESEANIHSQPQAAVVVLGENLKYGWPARRIAEATWNSSISNKIQAIAARLTAVDLMNVGYKVDIVNSTGDTAGIGVSEAEALRNYETTGNRLRLNGQIINETESLETPGNAEYTAEILRKKQYDKLVLLTAKDHMKRSNRLFRAFGINFDNHMASEDVYVGDPTISESTRERRKALINKYRRSVWGILEKIKEKIFTFELNFDPKGKLIHLIVGGFRERRNNARVTSGQKISQPLHA